MDFFIRRAVLLLLCLTSLNEAWGQKLYHYNEFGQRVALEVLQNETGAVQVQVGTPDHDRAGSRIEPARQVLTNQFVVKINPQADIRELADSWGVSVVGHMNWDSQYIILQANTPLEALSVANSAFERGDVAQVYNQFLREGATREVPNDANYGSQWHLRNTGQGGGLAGHDINVEPTWNFTNSTGLGTGVTVGIIDNRAEPVHADLSPNYRADRSLWMSGVASTHGTAVAGLVAARGNNGIGITGVAPYGSWAGLSLLSEGLTDANSAQALTHHFNTMNGNQFDGIHVYNNSWGPTDNGTRQASGPLARAAIESGATTGRGGLGNIYVWAGGNGGDGDNVNYDGFANSRFTIAVSATTNQGVRAGYSEQGACLLVNAMGDPNFGQPGLGITTTNTGGGYINSFGGTSAAAPIVSGVVALMLESNPNLGWRDVQHILVNTSRKNDAGNASWVTNAAGRQHSDLYGFGTIDATAAVTAADNWVNVGTELVATGLANVNQLVPDSPGGQNFGSSVLSSINISQNLLVENVEVILNTTGGFGGDLEVALISPGGTESVLARVHNHSAVYNNWLFSTVKNWSETSAGEWTLRLRDGSNQNVSLWSNWSLNVYGTQAIPEPGSGLLVFGLALGYVASRRRPGQF